MKNLLPAFILCVFATPLYAQENSAPSVAQGDIEKSIIENQMIDSQKERYSHCLIKRGRQINLIEGLRSAVDIAPIACRRELLQIKKTLLNSALRMDVIDALIASIEEAGKIDMVNELIDKSQQK